MDRGVVDDAEGLHSRSTMRTFDISTSVSTNYNLTNENQLQSMESEKKYTYICCTSQTSQMQSNNITACVLILGEKCLVI